MCRMPSGPIRTHLKVSTISTFTTYNNDTRTDDHNSKNNNGSERLLCMVRRLSSSVTTATDTTVSYTSSVTTTPRTALNTNNPSSHDAKSPQESNNNGSHSPFPQQQELKQEGPKSPPQLASTTNSSGIAPVHLGATLAPGSHRMGWLQKSIVRRTVSFVEHEMENVIETSQFLKEHHSLCIPRAGYDQNSSDKTYTTATNVAGMIGLFHRSEIVTGECLGRGGFAYVYEIVQFVLDDAISDRLTLHQQQIRQYYVETCQTDNGKGRYAIKHLKEEKILNSIMRKPEKQMQMPPLPAAVPTPPPVEDKRVLYKDFQTAALDLVAEAAYMSCLNHPNIVKVRGLPVDGIDALRDGRHDGYFIIMDTLTTTLDKRIHKEWMRIHQTIREKEDFFSSFDANTSGGSTSTNSYISTTEDQRRSLLCTKVDYARQLADAIEYLHSKNIIFRDLKPQNVGFMSSTAQDQHQQICQVDVNTTNVKTDQLVLFDFGLCRELQSSSSEKEADGSAAANTDNEVFVMSGVGTRRYMAPEVVNEERYNLKADVYGWSMVFWECLTCTKPFSDYSPEQHQRRVCQRGERPSLQPQLTNSNDANSIDKTTVTTFSDTTSSLGPVGDDWLRSISPIPKCLEDILSMTWEHDVNKRYTMKQLCESLRTIQQQEILQRPFRVAQSQSQNHRPANMACGVGIKSTSNNFITNYCEPERNASFLQLFGGCLSMVTAPSSSSLPAVASKGSTDNDDDDVNQQENNAIKNNNNDMHHSPSSPTTVIKLDSFVFGYDDKNTVSPPTTTTAVTTSGLSWNYNTNQNKPDTIQVLNSTANASTMQQSDSLEGGPLFYLPSTFHLPYYLNLPEVPLPVPILAPFTAGQN